MFEEDFSGVRIGTFADLGAKPGWAFLHGLRRGKWWTPEESWVVLSAF